MKLRKIMLCFLLTISMFATLGTQSKAATGFFTVSLTPSSSVVTRRK